MLHMFQMSPAQQKQPIEQGTLAKQGTDYVFSNLLIASSPL